MNRSVNVLQCFNVVLPVLNAIPDPIGPVVISALEEVLTAVQQARDNENQLKLLFSRTCDILGSLKVPQNFADETLQRSVETLVANLERIRDFAISLRDKNILKAMIQSSDIRLTIEELERNLWSSCLAFQNSALVLANQKLDDLRNLANDSNNNRISAEQLQAARLEDQQEQLAMIHEAVSSLSAGTPNMLDNALETINVDSTITVTGMTALLERHETGMIQLKDQELKFLRAGIARLTEQRSAEQVQIKSWTVTGLEVERGFLLGPDQASFIRAGRWLGKSVGIIEMKDVDTTLRFVKAWKNLRSHRIQGFVGASTVDNPPFILVQPSHLSISEYVTVTDRPIIRRLTYELVRALEYLHTRVPPVIHGGLRPANIDINSGNVLIGSIGLGLGHLRIPEHQRLALEPSLRQWTAPELLENPEMSPNTQTDIFSLGKIITELINIIHKRRPSANFPVLSSIAEKCTTVDPSIRPTISDIAEQFTEQSPHYQISDLFAPLPSASGPNTAELTGLLKINQWRVTPYTCTTPAVFKEEDHRYYVASAPLQGIHEHPLRQLCIEVNCHDQGENPSIRRWEGAWTWIELALLREGENGKQAQVNLKEALKDRPRGFMVEDTRYEIIRLPFADPTPRVHRVNLDWRNPFIKEARKGDVIALHPKARFPGRRNHIYSAEMHVITE